MRRTFFTNIALALILVLLAVTSLSAMDKSLESGVQEPFEAETVEAGATANSTAYGVGNARGYFSLQSITTGAGTLAFNLYISNDGENWISNGTIATGLSAGTNLATFSPPPVAFIKIQAEETGSTNSSTIGSSHLFIQ